MTDLCTGTKVCSKCGEEKPEICFAISKGKLYPWCRPCKAEYDAGRRKHKPHRITHIAPWNEPR